MPTEYTDTRTSFPERARGLSTHGSRNRRQQRCRETRLIWKSRDLGFRLLAQQTPGVTLGKPFSLGLFHHLKERTLSICLIALILFHLPVILNRFLGCQ